MQIAAAVPEQRRSGDRGRPVPGDRRRGRRRRRRALASPAAASAAAPPAPAEAARRQHELAAAATPAAPAATDHCRDRSCSIITIPSLRCYDARPGGLGSEEWVPFAGQAHIDQTKNHDTTGGVRSSIVFHGRGRSFDLTQGKRLVEPLHGDV